MTTPMERKLDREAGRTKSKNIFHAWENTRRPVVVGISRIKFKK